VFHPIPSAYLRELLWHLLSRPAHKYVCVDWNIAAILERSELMPAL